MVIVNEIEIVGVEAWQWPRYWIWRRGLRMATLSWMTGTRAARAPVIGEASHVTILPSWSPLCENPYFNQASIPLSYWHSTRALPKVSEKTHVSIGSFDPYHWQCIMVKECSSGTKHPILVKGRWYFDFGQGHKNELLFKLWWAPF
jgi:hypothetical protein